MEISHPETQPLVTAVIPTRNRPDLVCRAVRSALAQTYQNLEVVVVVDGPDPATVQALEQLHEPRLRIVALEENVGGSEARNIGVREAKGEWIALLDDDDEWKEGKTERQMSSILQKQPDALFSATQYYVRQHGRSVIRPHDFPTTAEHISEYLFCHLNRLIQKTTFLQTSNWLIKRTFLFSHPFSRGLKRNQDTDWLLRAFPYFAQSGVFVREPLAIFNEEHNGNRISTSFDWNYSYEWAKANAHLFTPKGISFFFILVCAREVALQRAGMKALRLLWTSCDRAATRSFVLRLCFAKRYLQCFVNMMQYRRKSTAA